MPQISIRSLCKHLMSLCNVPKGTLHPGNSAANSLNSLRGVFMLSGNLLYLFMCVYVCEYVCEYVFTCAYMHVYECVCIYVCIGVCVYIHVVKSA